MDEQNPYSPPQSDVAATPRGDTQAPREHEVSFVLTTDDIIGFARFHAKSAGVTGRASLRVLGTMVAAWGLWLMRDDNTPALIIVLTGIALFAFSFWVHTRAYYRWQLRRTKKSGRASAEGDWRVAIDADGVKVKTPVYQGTHGWAAIESVVDGGESILLYTSSASALIVVQRAFASPREADDFKASANAFLRADRAERGAPPPALPAPFRQRRRAWLTFTLWLVLLVTFLAIWLLTQRS